jgi:C-terminal processing protease CtpA/Prc
VPTFTPTYEANYDVNVLIQYFTKYSGHAMSSNWGGYATMDSIPYIALTTWVNGQTNVGEFDLALEQFRNSPGLIIDVRMNGGGNDLYAYQVAGRFTKVSRIAEFYQTRSGPRHADMTPLAARTVDPRGPWQYDGRVALLIGRKCYSSNESFVAAMKTIPTVTLIGDTTGGGSGNPAVYALSSGWQYSVSTWIAYTADTTVIEWRGIPPTIRVNTVPSDFSGGVDPVIETAKGWLKNPRAGIAVRRSPAQAGD